MAAPAIQHALDLFHAGRLDHAETALRRVLAREPDEPTALRTMAALLAMRQRYDQADFFFQRALRISPDNAPLRSNHAVMMLHFGRLAEARAGFERALALDPSLAEARTGMCAVLATQGDYERAVGEGEQALRQMPGHSSYAVNLGAALTGSGRCEEACAVYAEALRHDRTNPNLLCNHLGTLNYSPAASAEHRAAEARRWGPALEGLFGPARPRPPINEPDPDRPLRVGVLSSDLRGHVVATFLTPFFAGHDRSSLALHAFQTGVLDATSHALAARCASFTHALQLDDDALARAIREARIDVLIETNGHTEGSRPGVLARRPAPVIATYCGYPNTTGMPCVDFRVVDARTDPPGHEALSTERLIRLEPCFLCYAPPADPPPVAPHTQKQAAVTFGCFNSAPKINPPLLRLWARLLRAVPGSRLILKNRPLGAPEAQARVRAVFEAEGLDAGRIDLIGWRPASGDHLTEYHRVDIALDSLPYHGTTTTCEALLMGVPVITLAGAAHVTRVGASLLHTVGLDELIAADEDDYVRRAADLARDADRRGRLRDGLRERLLASPLCDAAAHSRAMEGAIRSMWREVLASSAAC